MLDSLSCLHSLPCFILCFIWKLLPMPRPTQTFKLAIILLLAADESLNHGPAVRRNIRLANTNIWSVRHKSAWHSDLIISKKIDVLAVTETRVRTSWHSRMHCWHFSFTFHHWTRSIGRGGGVGFLLFLVSSVEFICVWISDSSVYA